MSKICQRRNVILHEIMKLMHLLYNIFQTESNVMVDSGKIIEYITKHFLPTPTLQMHFTSLNEPVHLTKKLNKSKCTSEDSR